MFIIYKVLQSCRSVMASSEGRKKISEITRRIWTILPVNQQNCKVSVRKSLITQHRLIALDVGTQRWNGKVGEAGTHNLYGEL